MNFPEDVLTSLLGSTSRTSMSGSVEAVFADLFRADTGEANNGLPGLIARFENVGLGKIVHSWLKPGHHLPVSNDELRAVLGNNMVKSVAHDAALSEDAVLTELAQLLPGVVSRLTKGSAAP